MIIRNRFAIFVLLMSLYGVPVMAQVQDSTKKIMEDDFVQLKDENNDIIATFKTTRIANGHNIEQCKPGVLDVRINHRFGRISDGVYNFLGLDNAVTRIGFDYGITNYLMAGIGRSTLNKEYDAFAKLRLWRQKKNGFPVTINYLAGIYIVTEKYDIDKLPFANRLSYLSQLLIARKFNENLSLQLVPTFMHFNMTTYAAEENTIVALGAGGRYKLNKRLALTAEYYFTPGKFKREKNYNPLTIGLDIETGGHVFQLFFSNAAGISERSLFTNTLSQWGKGQLHFGFNISRVFTVHSSKNS